MTGFEHALIDLKRGGRWRRLSWQPGALIWQVPKEEPFGLVSFIAIEVEGGPHWGPWSPTHHDLLAEDWCSV
jgi:hypothetical protein